ncbi:hypothetical protein HOO68_06305 [Candidatus Gracilibacteria bacterium]|nr:hypothetical protein [Candidatus Gracilibacteria bacterium]
MQKISKFILISSISLCVLISTASGADYTGKSTVTTDPTKSTYYNNDLQNNGALSAAAKEYAKSNPKEAQKIIGQNGEQCGIQCAKAMEAAAAASKKGSSSSTDYSSDNILGQYNSDLREGNVDMNTVADVIIAMVEVLIGIAGTVAVFSLIYHGLQMQINSGITGDSSGVDKAKKGMIDAGIGFVIAISAWFLVTRAVDLLNFVS